MVVASPHDVAFYQHAATEDRRTGADNVPRREGRVVCTFVEVRPVLASLPLPSSSRAMKILPVFQLAAAPNLALTLARIAHTPRARLSRLLRLGPRNPRPACWNPHPPVRRCPVDIDRMPPNQQGAIIRREMTDALGFQHVFPQRDLGEALLVDRLVSGVIIGSELDILGQNAPVDEVACAASRLDVWA